MRCPVLARERQQRSGGDRSPATLEPSRSPTAQPISSPVNENQEPWVMKTEEIVAKDPVSTISSKPFMVTVFCNSDSEGCIGLLWPLQALHVRNTRLPPVCLFKGVAFPPGDVASPERFSDNHHVSSYCRFDCIWRRLVQRF
ncbi:uncharacterized protein LOC127673907 isoform X2 [Apodemus sylvaticus]|uniref:uncharacterized protein LOC127673907 isoform X2 n=1 Tax=Apodemus sylvaticus TaxID=10129 RepID=UPI002242DE63|nr:uncharacterized protein LOC127673907 isoform X2 [Apodemus sylvaticus]